MDMLKMIFTIDDRAGYEDWLKERGLDQREINEKMNELFNYDSSFKVIYTLYGNKKESMMPDRYELTDFDGNKVNINNLNGYEQGILNDCYEHFINQKYKCPCSIINIKEENI